MLSGFNNLIWNIRLKGWSYIKKYAGIAAALSLAGGSVIWGVHNTKRALSSIVASRALDRERAGAPEYLYFSDPAHEQSVREYLQDNGWTIWPYISRWARRGRRALWRRLLHVCRYGETQDRLRAVQHLTTIHHLKEWEKAWLGQRLDARTAVALAREGTTGGSELLRAPPLPSRCTPLLAPLAALADARPAHRCLYNFLQHLTDNSQGIPRLMEQETSGGGGSNEPGSGLDTEEETLLQSLLAVLHHIEQTPDVKGELSAAHVFVNAGGLDLIKQAAYSTERPLRIAAASLLLECSPHADLLPLLHRAGLLGMLSLWLGGSDAELGCMAGGALAGLEEGHSCLYGPAVQLLHPVKRPHTAPRLDLVTVHGLLGEPFVTWRQRDRGEDEAEAADKNIITNNEHSTIESKVGEEFEVVLRDLPESSLRDPGYLRLSHREMLGPDCEIAELQEHSRCWPRDWLPRDCPNIRVLGVSYATVMTAWGTSCERAEGHQQAGPGLEARAQRLGAALRQAGVGNNPIVWLAHSMGGLLVKQILVNSLESDIEDEKALARNTWGVIFYSTPHHGTRAAHALLWPSREVQDLREDCSALGKLHRRWLAGNWRCVCFGESRSTPLMTLPGITPALHLVPPASADAGVGPFYVLPLNHLDICKPATRDSFIYRMVVAMIQHAKGDRCGQEYCVECCQKSEKSRENILDIIKGYWTSVTK